ncbi:MAG TPA: class I adenylate-forming enzyme family protein [Jatrophihabitans sp.]
MAELVMTADYANLGDLLVAVAERYPENEAFVDGQQRLSFGDWHTKASSLAAALTERGISKGDVVVLTLPTGLDYAIAYCAVLLLGGIVTGVNPRLGPGEIAGILEQSAAAAVIEPAPADRRIPDGFAGLRITDEEVRAGYAHTPLTSRPSVTAGDPAVIVWTSGTTGAPKGAWFDHAALAAGARVSGLLSAPFDRRLMPTPFAHAGFMTRVWDQLAFVMTTILTPTPWSAPAMLAALVQEHVTVGQGVPTQWEKLLVLLHETGTMLPDLRIVGTGAAKVSAELVHDLSKYLGVPVLARYACTEAPSITGTRVDDPPEVLEQTVGRAQNGIRVRILNESLEPLPLGEVGRVAIASPFQMRGYWRAPELTAAAFTPDGWLVSSDLGTLDADGNLTLVGRTSEVYIRGGYNVYPLEVENVLTAHPDVAGAAVVGTPAAVIGEIGVAFVVPAAGREPTLEVLRAWCAEHIADYKAPDRLEIVAELPLTSMMKIDKLSLRRRAASAGPQSKRR